MKNTSKLLVAIGAGVAIGGLLGVLFAPGKGKDTRKKIADAGSKLSDAVKDTINKGKEKVTGFKDDIKERTNTVAEKIEEFA
jgi:gas vesicle protein